MNRKEVIKMGAVAVFTAAVAALPGGTVFANEHHIYTPPTASYDNTPRMTIFTIECVDEAGEIIHTETTGREVGYDDIIPAPSVEGYFLLGEDKQKIFIEGGGKTQFVYRAEYVVMENEGYISGYADGTFRPDDYMSRAAATGLLFRFHEGDVHVSSNTYDDVDKNAWYFEAVQKMANAGIVAGYEGNVFRPEQLITRGEFTLYAAKLFQVPPLEDDLPWFTDTLGIEGSGYFNRFEEQRYYPDHFQGTFQAHRPITRGEGVYILNNLLGRHADSWPEAVKSPYSDVAEDHWAFPAIMSATTAHELHFDNVLETVTVVLPEK